MRTPGQEAEAEVMLATSNMEPVFAEVATNWVYNLGIVPPRMRDAVAGEPYRVPVSDPRFVVALWGNELSGFQAPYENTRLVDKTLRTNTATVEQMSWDTFRLPAVPARYSIEFTSDSTGSILLEVQVIP